MSDKMRKSFEEWALSEGYPITRGHYFDVYASAETRAAYLAWQAAQSVPVVGEPVALREFADEVKQLCKDFSDRHNRPYMGDVTAAIDGLLAQFVAGQTSHATQAELDALHKNLRSAMQEASGLAMAMWRDFFKDASPNFGLCDSPAGVLSQIDNMYAGLRERIQLQAARIRELEIAIQEIIEQNHCDFRGHEIAESAIAKERQS